MSNSDTALIGYTGFVGSNLGVQYNFDKNYNSKNFKEMTGKSFSTVVCAGIAAIKWLANKEPETDIKKIKELANVLKTIQAETFILISTIDVYPTPSIGDCEDKDLSKVKNHAYGTHRLWFENFCKDIFPNILIVRLPGLFGDGLKKNVIYDLINDNCLEMINPASSYQYYYLANLWKDIQIALENNLKEINLFTEPVSSAKIISTFFPAKKVGEKMVPEGHYNATTKHAKLWGNDENYIYTEEEVLSQLEEYITTQK